MDVIGSNDLELPELLNNSSVNFLNLRGDQRSDANLASKVVRVLRYYWRLVSYAATARVKVFHILWNNKFELFDRTLLTLCYKLAGKRIVLTAHNVNMRKRDGMDSWLNRWSLRTQYRLADHIFVHTEKMKAELIADFAVQENKVSVIPFGINNTTPKTDLTSCDAKRMLGIADTRQDHTLLRSTCALQRTGISRCCFRQSLNRRWKLSFDYRRQAEMESRLLGTYRTVNDR